MTKADPTEERARKRIKEEAEVNEAYMIGLLWSNPEDAFSEFGYQLEDRDFTQKAYRFFFTLGRVLSEKNIKKFDDITILKSVGELGDHVSESFDAFGGLKTISELTELVKDGSGNVEHYINEIKRTRVLIDSYHLYGSKAIIETADYPLSDMNARDISSYWLDQSYRIQMDAGGSFEVEDLGMSVEDFFDELEQEQEEMLPYFGLGNLQYTVGGIPKGHVTMLGGFGGSGKSTLTNYTVIGSLLNEPDEKAIIVLNEESAMAFRKKVVMLILAEKFRSQKDSSTLKKEKGTYSVNRKNLSKNELKDSEKEALSQAILEMNKMLGDKGRIKAVFVERYIMSEIETIIRRFANRGYSNLIIDTHKVSEESKYNARWETFVEDMKTYYRLTRKEAGGLNLRTFITFQLADSAIHNKFLDFEAIGEGKASKNEASVVMMFRKVWGNEYPDGKQPIKVFKKVKKELAGKTEWKEKVIPLDPSEIYYLLFVPKNRFGQSNDTGLPVMVIKPDFNYGRFFDVGWTRIADDKSR